MSHHWRNERYGVSEEIRRRGWLLRVGNVCDTKTCNYSLATWSAAWQYPTELCFVSFTACALLTPEGDLCCQLATLSVSFRSLEKYSVDSNVRRNIKTSIDSLETVGSLKLNYIGRSSREFIQCRYCHSTICGFCEIRLFKITLVHYYMFMWAYLSFPVIFRERFCSLIFAHGYLVVTYTFYTLKMQ
jgi:hypothetical protein